MHGSLVTSSLLSETQGDESLNAGYNFGQEGVIDIHVSKQSDKECTRLFHTSLGSIG